MPEWAAALLFDTGESRDTGTAERLVAADACTCPGTAILYSGTEESAGALASSCVGERTSEIKSAVSWRSGLVWSGGLLSAAVPLAAEHGFSLPGLADWREAGADWREAGADCREAETIGVPQLPRAFAWGVDGRLP